MSVTVRRHASGHPAIDNVDFDQDTNKFLGCSRPIRLTEVIDILHKLPGTFVVPSA